MGSDDEIDLVRRAILDAQRFRGCCEWDDRAARRFRDRPPAASFTPEFVRERLVEFVFESPESVRQVREKRSEYGDRDFYYKVILPVSHIVEGLFVELILVDDDPDSPSVLIVNAHRQGV